jgi:hypothetical protein
MWLKAQAHGVRIAGPHQITGFWVRITFILIIWKWATGKQGIVQHTIFPPRMKNTQKKSRAFLKKYDTAAKTGKEKYFKGFLTM